MKITIEMSNHLNVGLDESVHPNIVVKRSRYETVDVEKIRRFGSRLARFVSEELHNFTLQRFEATVQSL